MSSGVCVIRISPAALFSPLFLSVSHLALIVEAVWSGVVLYLRHLGEQADGQRQREAEGEQAHEAVDGQQQSAVSLQESQPTKRQW